MEGPPMPAIVRYRPGIQTTTETDPLAQRRAIAAALDRLSIRVRLHRDQLLDGAGLLALDVASARALGFDFCDLWELLDDAACSENQGRVIELFASALAST